MKCKVGCEVRPFGRKQWWSLVPVVYHTSLQPGIWRWTRGEAPVLPIPPITCSVLALPSVGSKMLPSAVEMAQIPR